MHAICSQQLQIQTIYLPQLYLSTIFQKDRKTHRNKWPGKNCNLYMLKQGLPELCVSKRLILRNNMSNNLCCIAQSGEFKDHAREDMSLYLLTERTVIVCHPLYKLKYPSICKM